LVKYPEGKKSSQPIRIAKGLDKAISDFLESDKAQSLGFRFKSDIINAALRDFLIRYGVQLETGPRFTHFNVYEDHATIMDRERNRLVDVYFRNGRAYCELDQTSHCEHIDFALTQPKIVDPLRQRGWKIEEGRIVSGPN
jgi:hypothetical protein